MTDSNNTVDILEEEKDMVVDGKPLTSTFQDEMDSFSTTPIDTLGSQKSKYESVSPGSENSSSMSPSSKLDLFGQIQKQEHTRRQSSRSSVNTSSPPPPFS